MASIFDLKTNVGELSSANQATSRMSYEQHPPTRDVTLANFPNGAIHFRFETSGQKWWIPSRTYIRMRATLTKEDGTILELSDDVAPNMGLCANLYQSAEFRIADKTVSRVSDYMAQVDALDTRISKSKSWINSVGYATNWLQDKQNTRLNQVSRDGQDVNSKTLSSVSRLGLGYGAASTYEILTDSIDLLAAGANLVVGSFVVGDIFKIVGGAGDLTEYVIRAVTLDTVAQQTYVIDIGAEPRAAANGNFSRVRTNNPSRRVGQFEMTWQPPLSIFKIPTAVPSGRYELVLNPQTSSQYRKRAIESLLADKTPGAGNDYDFQITDMYLYVATVDGTRADDLTYLLDLEEIRCQVDSADVGGAGFFQKNFDVSPSTFALTTAFQDTRAGSLTQYSASKFKINSTAQDELKLNRMFISYAGQQKPSPDADPEFNINDDRTIQRYLESQIQTGAYFDCGGAEDIEEYHNRGSYYYFAWPRDGTDRSTRVQVHYGFSGAVANSRVLLFDHAKKTARIEVKDGRVINVQVEDA